MSFLKPRTVQMKIPNDTYYIMQFEYVIIKDLSADIWLIWFCNLLHCVER